MGRIRASAALLLALATAPPAWAASPPPGGDGNWYFVAADARNVVSLLARPEPGVTAPEVELIEHVEHDMLEELGLDFFRRQYIRFDCATGTMQRGRHEYRTSGGRGLPATFESPYPLKRDAAPRAPEKGTYEETLLALACATPGTGPYVGRPRRPQQFLHADVDALRQRENPTHPIRTVQGVARLEGRAGHVAVSGESSALRAAYQLGLKCEEKGTQCPGRAYSRRCIAVATDRAGGMTVAFGDTGPLAREEAARVCKAAGDATCTVAEQAVCP